MSEFITPANQEDLVSTWSKEVAWGDAHVGVALRHDTTCTEITGELRLTKGLNARMLGLIDEITTQGNRHDDVRELAADMNSAIDGIQGLNQDDVLAALLMIHDKSILRASAAMIDRTQGPEVATEAAANLALASMMRILIHSRVDEADRKHVLNIFSAEALQERVRKVGNIGVIDLKSRNVTVVDNYQAVFREWLLNTPYSPSIPVELVGDTDLFRYVGL